MRIFYSFLIVLVSVFLFLLPITDMVYEFRTDSRTDDFSIDTGVGVSTANATLFDFIYDDDTGTASFASTIDEIPTYSTYNSSSKTMLIATLTENTTRTLSITYDIDAISENDAVNNLLDRVAWIWMLITIAFPAASLAAMWTGRA